MLVKAIEKSKLPPNEVRLLQVALANTIQKMENWRDLGSKQRRDMQMEIQSHLLIHRNFMDTLEFFQRKWNCLAYSESVLCFAVRIV
jgi:hypothetical protein